jgi:hypothetical protein
MNTKIKLLVDGVNGQYVPSSFIRCYDMNKWHIKERARSYREADDEMKSWIWDDILNEAYYIDEDGYKWDLYQDGDLFAVREDYEWED